jgi:hypothetical protein
VVSVEYCGGIAKFAPCSVGITYRRSNLLGEERAKRERERRENKDLAKCDTSQGPRPRDPRNSTPGRKLAKYRLGHLYPQGSTGANGRNPGSVKPDPGLRRSHATESSPGACSRPASAVQPTSQRQFFLAASLRACKRGGACVRSSVKRLRACVRSSLRAFLGLARPGRAPASAASAATARNASQLATFTLELHSASLKCTNTC